MCIRGIIILIIAQYINISHAFTERIILDKRNSKLFNQQTCWEINSIIPQKEKYIYQFGISMWIKTKSCKYHEIQFPLMEISKGFEQASFGLSYGQNEFKSNLYPYMREGQYEMQQDCVVNEWSLIVISFQQDIFIQIISQNNGEYQLTKIQNQTQISLTNCMIIQYSYTQSVEQSDLFLYYNDNTLSMDLFQKRIFNFAVQINNCRIVESYEKQLFSLYFVINFVQLTNLSRIYFQQHPNNKLFKIYVIDFKTYLKILNSIYQLPGIFKFQEPFISLNYYIKSSIFYFLSQQYITILQYSLALDTLIHKCSQEEIQGKVFENINKVVSIVSFYLKNIENSKRKNNRFFQVSNQIDILVQRIKNSIYIVLYLSNQEYFLGFVDDQNSNITIQIELNQSPQSQCKIQLYLNEYLKEEIMINRSIITSQIKIKSQYFLIENLVILQNFKIKKITNTDQQIKGCILQAFSISKEIKNYKICILYQISNNDLIFLQRKRNLQSIQFIHGSNMRSIVRNQYSNSQYKTKITSAQSITTVMIIGYFKLSQAISGTQYLPLITIGVQSDYYNFLNIYIKSTTIIELKYIHDTNNIISKQPTTLSSFSNTWKAFGLIYSKTDQKAKSIYSDSNSKLFSSIELTSVILPSTISTLDVCISCSIEGGVFGKFNGLVSTVKVINDVDYTNVVNYYLFNEVTAISKSQILNTSFNLNTYTQNSEYDISQGFLCNSGYVFFEGICIDENNCKNLISESDSYSSFEMAKYYDVSTKKCLNCGSNCLQCNSNTDCTICRPSYKIDNGNCIRCDSINSCNSSCSGSQIFDPLNQICVDSFSINSITLSNLLVGSRIFSDNSDILVENSPPFSSIYDQIVHCYIDVDNNPMTLYSFLGGDKFTQSTILKKKWAQIPKGYKKSVTFFVLFYGSGTTSNLEVKINSNLASLDVNYQIVVQNKISCSGSGSQTQSIFKVTYTINDYSNVFDLSIKSSSSSWGIRNLNIEISKCHPTCDSCKSGGSSSDCTSCQNSLTMNKFQCICPSGQYAKQQNCFDTPCVICQTCSIANCQKCEDISGLCTQCISNYSIQDGQCIQNSSCNTNNQVYFNYCGVSKELGFNHFKTDKVVQYGDYWKFYNSDVTAFSCIAKKCLPRIVQNQQHTLEINMPNYKSYHYQLSYILQVFLYQSIDTTDYVNIYDQSVRVFRYNFGYQKYQITGAWYSDYFFSQTVTYEKTTAYLLFKFESECNETIDSEAHSFTDIVFNYVRCHPLCKQCTGGNTQAFCTNCIDNATKVSGSCQCNSGYFFSLVRFPIGDSLPGSCLQCNPACSTCTGPSYQDCVNCQNGYTRIGNICQYNCQEGKYWDQTSLSCLNCHPCSKSCEGGLKNNCHDCYQDKTCSVHNVICEELCTVAVNSLCGKTQPNHNDCFNNGWRLIDSNSCINCSKYVNGKCGGYYSQDISDLCLIEGFQNYDNNNCSSCKIIVSVGCGRSEIQDKCANNGWIQIQNQSECQNCNQQSFNQCNLCHDSCLTCSSNYNPMKCTSCNGNLIFFNNQCLLKCPNGYIYDQQTCIPCTDKQMSNCVSCFKTCLICYPFQISLASNTCTLCSTQTRQYVNGQCKCQDPEDIRESFHECSFQNIAVLDAILSNSTPLLTIYFGKQLVVPNNFQINTFSQSLCQYLFADETLLLLGTSQCKISNTYISVNLDESADIIHGDLIQFKKNILRFVSSNQILIDTFMKKMVVQDQILGQTLVQLEYQQVVNSCQDINIKLLTITNDSNRRFKSVQWSIQSYIPSNPSEQAYLLRLLQEASSLKKLDIYIPKGIIKVGVQVTLILDYLLKVNVIGHEEFHLSVKPEKIIYLDIQSPIINPFFKYQSGIIIIQPVIKICNQDGDIKISEPLDISIKSNELSSINYENNNFLSSFYVINLQPYTLNIGIKAINVKAKLLSDQLVKSEINYQLDVQSSKLYIKIIGGNGYFNHKKPITISSKVRDQDLKNEADPQGISIQWKCQDPDKLGNQVILPSLQPTATIQADTFKPYSSVKVTLIGQKDIRSSSDSVIILFSELDLPPLGVELNIQDPKKEVVSLNEEIVVQLDYDSNVNVDQLTFSGTIYYDEKVVGVIKFDYVTFRFTIKNYFSDFKRDLASLQFRFNVFNPQYYMPSIFKIALDINFPPFNCKLNVPPKTEGFYSLETKFFIEYIGCEDEDQPIQYIFNYYSSVDDFEYEQKNPAKIKRRQLNDKQKYNYYETSLPSGKLLILVLSVDSKNNVYNSTIEINVQQKKYNEQQYLQLIQQTLDQVNNLEPSKAITALSIICDDILQRIEFKSSTLINSKKIEIQDLLISLQQKLSPLSSMSSLADKAIVSLNKAGIVYTLTYLTDVINQLIASLDRSSILQQDYLALSQEKLKQKLYDVFQLVDIFLNSDQCKSAINKIIQLNDKIRLYLSQDILPNEDPVLYQGEKVSLLITQITEKHICSYFLCEVSNSTDSSKQTSIYNFKKSEFLDNPYTQDETFQNYTKSLKQQNSSLNISSFKVMIPEISSKQNVKLENFPKQAILSFPNQIENPDLKKMVCFSKNQESGWVKNKCKNIYDKIKNQYICFCNELSPTTVIDDLEELIDNENVDTVFSEEGISNISNFQEFYKYAAFWVLLFKTLLLLKFYFVGKKFDICEYSKKLEKLQNLNIDQLFVKQKTFIAKNKILPQTSTFNKSPSQSTNQNDQKAQTSFMENTIQSPVFKPTESPYQQSNTPLKSMFSKNTQVTENANFIDFDKSPQNQNYRKYSEQYQDDRSTMSPCMSPQLSPKNQSIDFDQGLRSKTNSLQKINSVQRIQVQPKRNTKYKFIMYGSERKIDNQDKDVDNFKLDNNQEDAKDINDVNKQVQHNSQCFNMLPFYKQVAIFHNFFGIFFIFNPSVSRVLRFIVFYVRSIHSLGISVIFDQNYSIIQQIVIAVFNSISVIVFVKILELSFSFRGIIGKILSRIMTISIILGYYYVIFSVVSSQTANQSNQFFLTFLLYYFGDIFVVSIISAIIQRQIAKNLLKKQNIQGLSKVLFRLLQIKLVIIAIV